MRHDQAHNASRTVVPSAGADDDDAVSMPICSYLQPLFLHRACVGRVVVRREIRLWAALREWDLGAAAVCCPLQHLTWVACWTSCAARASGTATAAAATASGNVAPATGLRASATAPLATPSGLCTEHGNSFVSAIDWLCVLPPAELGWCIHFVGRCKDADTGGRSRTSAC